MEGLSVAAITYYVVGLIGDLTRGLRVAGWLWLDTDLVMGLSIPVLVLGLGFALHHVRKRVAGPELTAAEQDV